VVVPRHAPEPTYIRLDASEIQGDRLRQRALGLPHADEIGVVLAVDRGVCVTAGGRGRHRRVRPLVLRRLRGQGRTRAVRRPGRAHVAQQGNDRVVHLAIAVGRAVEQEIGPLRLQILEVLGDHVLDRHQAADVGRPEPVVAAGGVDLLFLLGRVRVAGRRPPAPRLLEVDDVHVPGVGEVRVIGQQAVRLQRLHQAADLLVRHGVVAHLPGPAVHDQDGDGTIVGEQFGELCLDVGQLGGREVSGADVVGGVPDRIVETGQKAAAAERVYVLAHHVALAVAPGDVTDVEVAGAARPQREAVVMLRGEHAILHLGGDRRVGPLAGIEPDRVEEVDVQVRLRPRAGVREDPEVKEHAEAQVDEIALKLFQRFRRGSAAGAGGGRRLFAMGATGRQRHGRRRQHGREQHHRGGSAHSRVSLPLPRRGARVEYVEVGLARPTRSWKYRGPSRRSRPCES